MVFMGPLLGITAPFNGARLITEHRLWVRLLPQAAINLVVAVGCVRGAWYWWGVELGMGAEAWWSRFALWSVSLLTGLALFIGVQPAVNGAWNASLSARIEARLTGQKVGTTLKGRMHGVLRGLLHGLVRTVLFACGVLLLIGDRFLIGLLSGWAAGLLAAAGALILLALLAYDGFDPVLARNGLSFGKRWLYLAAHPALTLGYGIGLALLYLIPFALAVAPAFAAAGATFAYVQIQGRRTTGGTAPTPLSKGPSRSVNERNQTKT